MKRTFFLLFLIWIAHLSAQDTESGTFSILLKNKVEVEDNNIHNLTFVSVPFSGHFKVLMKSALNLSKKPKVNISFIITGWDNIEISREDYNKLVEAGISVYIVNDLHDPAHAFQRVINLVDKVIVHAKGSDLIIYDFFAMEGYFASKQLSIPAICSIPAIVEPIDPSHPDFQRAVKKNRHLITSLEQKFSVDISHKLRMVSGAFLLPSDEENVVWSQTDLKNLQLNKPQTDLSFINTRFLIKWMEGDLLFGINDDRRTFAKLSGLENFFKIGDIRPFSELFSDSKNINALPKIIDQYNDVLRNPRFFQEEVVNSKFQKYKKNLEAFHQFLQNHPNYLQPLGCYPEQLSEEDPASLETIWNMCLGGLDYFLHHKNATIHFVVSDYNPHINMATSSELRWLKRNWNNGDGTLKRQVKFYLIQDDDISLVDPEKFNWFQKTPETVKLGVSR